VAAAGFEILAFRDWQLRFAGTCALLVAERLATRAEGLRVPARLLEPEDGFVLQRIQAGPAALTPRRQSPNWAMRAAGAGPAYWEAMSGVCFPLSQAGVAWERCLGGATAEGDRFDHALGKLRLGTVGLTVRRRVAIAGEPVDWAIAGLLPNGEAFRLAVLVRSPASPLGALREDLADDAVAAAGFEMLAFRDWQLRFAGTCALLVAERIAKQAEGLRVPARLLEPEDGFILNRIQAGPAALTPRRESPNWALRESLRAAHPLADRTRLLAIYEDQVIARTLASSEDEEWTVWG
jgi:hypothetical protein